MIDIRCESKDTLRLCEMYPFQGDLKKRSKAQVQALEESLQTEGLIAPFFIWRSRSEDEVINWLLDGHARWETIKGMADKGDKALYDEQEFPVIYIEAGDIDEAKKALLQITSQYGKVTKEGAINFCSTIAGYTAPSVASYLKKAAPIKEKIIKVEEKVSQEPVVSNGEVKLTIAVPAAYEKAVRDLFNSVSYIKVL